MNLNAKISLVVSVLDELVTIGYLTHPRHKLQAVALIRDIMSDYSLPPFPAKEDISIYSIQVLANVQGDNLDRQLSGLATLAEKALSELHNLFAQSN